MDGFLFQRKCNMKSDPHTKQTRKHIKITKEIMQIVCMKTVKFFRQY